MKQLSFARKSKQQILTQLLEVVKQTMEMECLIFCFCMWELGFCSCLLLVNIRLREPMCSCLLLFWLDSWRLLVWATSSITKSNRFYQIKKLQLKTLQLLLGWVQVGSMFLGFSPYWLGWPVRETIHWSRSLKSIRCLAFYFWFCSWLTVAQYGCWVAVCSGHRSSAQNTANQQQSHFLNFYFLSVFCKVLQRLFMVDGFSGRPLSLKNNPLVFYCLLRL